MTETLQILVANVVKYGTKVAWYNLENILFSDMLQCKAGTIMYLMTLSPLFSSLTRTPPINN